MAGILYKDIAINRIKALKKVKRDCQLSIKSFLEYLPKNHKFVLDTEKKIADIELKIAETKRDLETLWKND